MEGADEAQPGAGGVVHEILPLAEGLESIHERDIISGRAGEEDEGSDVSVEREEMRRFPPWLGIPGQGLSLNWSVWKVAWVWRVRTEAKPCPCGSPGLLPGILATNFHQGLYRPSLVKSRGRVWSLYGPLRCRNVDIPKTIACKVQQVGDSIWDRFVIGRGLRVQSQIAQIARAKLWGKARGGDQVSIASGVGIPRKHLALGLDTSISLKKDRCFSENWVHASLVGLGEK